jgi:hypothetical protein
MKCHPVFHGTTISVLMLSSLVAVLASPGRAAGDASAAAEALAPGSWSVQFSVQPNFTLGSYAGSTLSAKRHLGNGHALRFGVTLSGGTRSDGIANTTADTLATNSRSSDADGNSWTIGLGGTYLWYSQAESPIHVYGGAGPSASWSRGHDQRTQSLSSGQPPNIQAIDDETTSHAWQVGVAGVLGVEWLVARRVGLIAEYGSSLSYTALESTRNATFKTGSASTTNRDEQTSHRWDFSGSGGRLGVSAYF